MHRIGQRSATCHLVIEVNTLIDSPSPALAVPLPRDIRTAFPFVPMSIALTLLRAGVAALFMAHATVRVMTPGSVVQFGRFMEHAGFPNGTAVVITLTVFELLGGLLLLLGVRTRVMASGFSLILLVGIVIIHRHFGWFVGEHGTGGSEYSVALLLALLVIMSADASGADRGSSASARRSTATRHSPNAA